MDSNFNEELIKVELKEEVSDDESDGESYINNEKLVHNYNAVEIKVEEGIKQERDCKPDAECGSDNDMAPAEKKPKRKVLDWQFVQRFENFELAKTAMTAEGTWSKHHCNQTDEGRKIYYRCNKLQRRGPQCSSKMYLLCESTSDAVSMFKTSADHDHDEKKEFISWYGLSDAVKSEINRLFDLKMKPRAIMASLSKMKNITVPRMSQLRNYLGDLRRTIDQSTLSIGELEAWIHSHSSVPLDPHEVFVVCHQVDDSNTLFVTPAFRFVISTKNLIGISKDESVVHANTTHKLIWQGFPVLVCGTTDKNHKFHPICVMISSYEQQEDFKFMFQGLKDKIQEIFESSWNPKVLVCDAANIQNAFLEVFGDQVVVRMCWTHVRRNIQEWIERVANKELRDSILSDVDSLHSITDENIFYPASEAFLQKYNDQLEFVTFFRAQWLAQNRNWFLGAAPNSSSTNNALESFIKVIKNNNSLRERLPLPRFLVVANEMVLRWSIKYVTNPEDNYVANMPTLSTKLWTQAFQWAQKLIMVNLLRKDDKYDYYQIPAGEDTKCEVFDAQWESFDDFKKQYFSKWLVLLPIERNDWMKGKCNCPDFFNFFMCTHVIGLAIRLQYVDPPLEAKTIATGEKRKRGRPPKSKRAAIIQ